MTRTLLKTNNFNHLKEFIILYFILCFVSVVIAGIWPAQDTFSFYQPLEGLRHNIPISAGVYHLHDYLPLRDGLTKVINLSKIYGMVTFPSFHTIMGLLMIWASRCNKLLLIVVLIINGLMIASCPVFGGHYLIDIIAGFVLTILGIVMYHLIQRYSNGNSSTHKCM